MTLAGWDLRPSPCIVCYEIQKLAEIQKIFKALTNPEKTSAGKGLLNNGTAEKEMLNDDTLMEYANASHIERASRRIKEKNEKMNGDSVPVEPAKTVNQSPGVLEPEMELNVEDITMLRSESVNSITASAGRSSRLGRVFHTRHAKSSKNRGNLPRGEVEMSIRYAEALRKLVVQVLGARDLLPWEKDGECNPYATVKVVSVENNKEISKRKTGVVKNSLNPSFDNHFEFDMDAQDIHNYRLQILVKDDTNYGTFSRKPVLGQIDIRLATLPKCELPQQWVRLEAERS